MFDILESKKFNIGPLTERTLAQISDRVKSSIAPVLNEDLGASNVSVAEEGPTCMIPVSGSNPWGKASNQIVLNVYWRRAVAFDENGRAKRRSELAWESKLFQDLLGVYHVGIEAYGVEFTFGNS